MKKILYTKYNSHRKPEFQTKTVIYEDEGKRYILKSPLNKSAENHIEHMEQSYQKLKEQYESIGTDITLKPVACKKTENGVEFPFVEGQSLMENLDLSGLKQEELTQKVKDACKLILPDEGQHSFQVSDDFKLMFPGCYEKYQDMLDKEMSYDISNIDSIFDNFILQDTDWYCIDYEWVFHFDVPVRYLKYRTLLYMYEEKRLLIETVISQDEFLKQMGYSQEDLAMFHDMEECFQQYVHGTNREYIYHAQYEKEILPVNLEEIHARDERIADLNKVIADLHDAIELKDNHIHNQDNKISDLEKVIEEQKNHILEIQRQLSKLQKAVRNPAYYSYLVGKKFYNKVYNVVMPEDARENKKADKRWNKYDYLRKQKEDPYEDWIKGIEEKYTTGEVFEYNPKISILVPVYNVLDRHLIPCIESVINQTYTNWELCLADDCSSWESVGKTLRKYEDGEKIKVCYRKENGHISRSTNSALEMATGEYIALLDCDDVLAPNALYEMVKELNKNPELDFIYSDEDKLDDEGTMRHTPHFKPDWSPDTLLSHMYPCHFSIYRKSIAEEIGGLRVGYEGSQDYDFALRFTEKTNRVGHIAKILYHWRERIGSTAVDMESKPYVMEATRKAKEDALRRRGIMGEVEQLDVFNCFRINYAVTGNPKVSILIPSKDNFDILKRCVESIYEKTTYQNFEIVLVDNGSTEENRAKYQELADKYQFRYIYQKMEFNFSKMCNLAAQHATGTYFMFLNDDTEVKAGVWLERMLGQAQQSHIGAVGAKLLYPETYDIQHIGIINLHTGPAHCFHGMPGQSIYYFGRNYMEYDYIAVTAACMMVSKEKFEEVGGFEEELAIAYNDVDFCFKLLEHGYYNIVRNDAVLLHYESVSRGDDLVDETKVKRLQEEQKVLYERHPQFYNYDPFYNVNLCQYDVNFTNNYDRTEVHYNQILPKMPKTKETDRLLANVDIIRKLSRILYLEGWAFLDGYRKNNDNDVKLVLYNDENKYVIETDKVYRQDVAEAFPDKDDIEFTGFRLEILREDIKPGTYHVYLICNDYGKQMDDIVEV